MYSVKCDVHDTNHRASLRSPTTVASFKVSVVVHDTEGASDIGSLLIEIRYRNPLLSLIKRLYNDQFLNTASLNI